MKKTSILAFTVLAALSVAPLASCNTQAKNSEAVGTGEAYSKDFESYKVIAYRKISDNEIRAAKLQDGIGKLTGEDRVDYSKKIFTLEEKNLSLKDRISSYRLAGKENWEAFKTEFAHDLDELDDAFKDLTSELHENNVDT